MLYSTSACPEYTNHTPIDTDLDNFQLAKDEKQKWQACSVADIADFFLIPRSPAFQHITDLYQHHHYTSGQRIFSRGEKLHCLYLIHSGFTKSVILDEFGNEQVVNFQMKGNILGVDGFHYGVHNSEAVALADCDIILVPIKKLKSITETYHQFETAMLNAISMELVHQQNRLCLLAARNSEVRVANFLLNLADRFFKLGYSKSIFNLRMSRNDLGSYLGLTLETVSRTLSYLDTLGLIEVNNRGIIIRDALALQNLTNFKKNALREQQS